MRRCPRAKGPPNNTLAAGWLPLGDAPEELHGLRVHWDSILRVYQSTSDIQYLTAEGSEHPGRLTGLVEFRTQDEARWRWSRADGTLEQWRLNAATLEPTEREWVLPGFGAEFLAQVQGSLPARATECWMPLYSRVGQVWSSFVAKTTSTAANATRQPAYVIVDLVIGDLATVFSGVTIGNGVAVLVDSSSSTLLGSTSADVLAYRTVGAQTVATLVNESLGASLDAQRVAAVNALVERTHGGWHALSLALDDDYAQPTRTYSVSVGGAKTLVSFALVKRACLSWVVAVAAEEASAAVDAVPIAVAIATTAGALVVVGALSYLLARPITRLGQRMEAAAHLQFSKRQADLSLFSEFRELNESFRMLSAGIEAMTRYVPMPVVDSIMASCATAVGSAAARDGLLAVSLRRVTIMFCDIRGFTTLSEKLTTSVVVQMLFDWLGAYTKVIVRNGGTVDKYVGDCIMALWNAPLDTEAPDAKACAAALEFAGALAALNADFAREGLPGLYVRVGVHSGELFVGNIGCEEHINYTVCGTPANTAARIEQLGKVYGLTPLVSGDVAAAVGGQFVCVWLDELRLRGHESTVTNVYHVAARASEAGADRGG
eukprot:m51a1_g12107 putative adenylate guanylate cyclase (603) ;mRNA; f:3170-5374